MSYFDKLAELGFMVVCRRNTLGTTTMFAVRERDVCPEGGDLLLRWSGNAAGDFTDVLADLPEWRVVDFIDDNASNGAQKLYEKLTCTGGYSDYDQRMAGRIGEEFLIGFEHRPESERFIAVDA